jgi:hypothetical protein
MSVGIGQANSLVFIQPPSVGGNENLEETLAIGNETNGNNIIVSGGDFIQYKQGLFTVSINTLALTDNRNIKYPDKDGTVALLSDIPAGEDLEETLDLGDISSRSGGGFASIHELGIDRTALIHFNNNFGIDLTLQSNTNTITGLIEDFNDFHTTEFDMTPTQIGISVTDDNTGGSMGIRSDRLAGIFITDGIFDKGLVGADDYSANYDDNTYVQKKYVDGLKAYTEKFGNTFANTSNNTWQLITVAGAPINTLVQILIFNADVNIKEAGARSTGSALERKAGARGDSFVIDVMLDNNGQCEFFSEDILDITFRLFGVTQ